jgi:ABC-type transport system substrate-binding protein
MADIGIRTTGAVAQWPEQLKLARAGKLQVWSLAGSATNPDGLGSLMRFDSTQAGGQNFARFRSAEFDAVYRRLSALPDGPEREALFREAKLLAVAYMPYKMNVHRISTDMWHPWVDGVRRPLFWQDWFHMVDIDRSQQAAP